MILALVDNLTWQGVVAMGPDGGLCPKTSKNPEPSILQLQRVTSQNRNELR